MTGTVRAFLRLLAVQGAWNYERMTGIGLGYAAEPLLEDLKAADPVRHAEASVRAAEYFNSHPYLAGVALGALVRAEYDGVPGAQISRLRAALCSPLGALGDQVFWAGLVPAAMAIGILGAVLGHPFRVLLAVLVGYNLVRLATGVWALRVGLGSGMQVAAALSGSWLQRLGGPVGAAAGFLVGLALPLAAAWLFAPGRPAEVAAGLLAMLLGLLGGLRLGARLPTLRFALAALGLAAVVSWVAP